MEAQQGPGLHHEDDPRPRPLRPPTRRRPGGLCRRVRAAEPATPPWAWLVPPWPAGAAACDLHPYRRGPAHARRAGPGVGADVLPVPRPQALDRVPRLLPPATAAVPDRAALPDLRQLRATSEGRGRDLVRRPRHRAGVHPVQRVLAELDRSRVHRAALLHPRRQRLPLPHSPGEPRSPATYAGPTATPSPSGASRSAPRSADRITCPTLPDTALAGRPTVPDEKGEVGTYLPAGRLVPGRTRPLS